LGDFFFIRELGHRVRHFVGRRYFPADASDDDAACWLSRSGGRDGALRENLAAKHHGEAEQQEPGKQLGLHGKTGKT